MRDMNGQKAIGFELKDTAGLVHNLEGSEGRWLLLLFHRHLG